MCGITGLWSPDRDQDGIRLEVRKAVASLRHRGPDDEGIWTNGTGVALGHTRLSILDLSDFGHQPMSSSDGRRTIVFNGEIYNFIEIRERLTATGHSFAGTGDTEVILHAFQEWGSDAVRQFIGMFAIAIWDEKERTIELIRDRVGVKPLHYGWDGRTFCFGSELKALRAFTHWSPGIDFQALGEFLQYGYIAQHRTIYKGIRKLQPGCRLVLKEGQQPVVESWWSAPEVSDSRPSASDADLESELELLLIDSFQRRMVSDVPVGVYLSGGVDSSLVTAILGKHHGQQIRTFTIGFSESSHNEARWAKEVARHCGSRHTEYILSIGEALDIAKDWGRLFDEPFGDSSGIPTLLVSRLASREVKVVLSADGGDELFSGYNVYSTVLNRMKRLQSIPGSLAAPLCGALSLLPTGGKHPGMRDVDFPGSQQQRPLPRIRRFCSMLADPTAGNLMNLYLSHWAPCTINRLIGNYDPPRPSANTWHADPAVQMSLWDIHHYLPEDILTKVDRTTMAVSIEGREPLLDHRLVEYALALPPHLRRGEFGPKHLLKSILYRYVPRAMVDRPKQGFAIPLETWLKTDLKELVQDYLSTDRLRAAGIMDPNMVEHAVKRFYQGDALLSRPLWLLLAFEMWRENWG